MRASLCVLAALMVAGPVMAQEAAAEQDWVIVTDTRANGECTPETARRLSFADIVAASESDKQCVTVEGLWTGNHLYDGIDAYYLASRTGTLEPAPSRLGVYGWFNRIEPPYVPQPVQLTGRVGDCEDLGGANVMMISGYCHNASGGYIALGSAVPTGSSPDRLIGTEARMGLGQLLEPTEDWSHRPYVEQRAWKWLENLRSGDIPAYAIAMGLEDYNADPAEPFSETHALFREPGSVFDRLRDEQVSELRIWLFAPRKRDADEPPANPQDVDALACFRLGTWTEDRWPVAFVDADNAPERPYACIAMSREVIDGRVDEWLDVPHSRHSLAEPTHFPPESTTP